MVLMLRAFKGILICFAFIVIGSSVCFPAGLAGCVHWLPVKALDNYMGYWNLPFLVMSAAGVLGLPICIAWFGGAAVMRFRRNKASMYPQI